MTREGGTTLFAVCESVEVNRVEVYTTPKQGDPIPALQWAAEGTAIRVEAPFEFRFGVPPVGLSSVEGGGELRTAGQYVVMNFDFDAGGEAQSGVFASWDGDLISDEYWLTADGKKSAVPCR